MAWVALGYSDVSWRTYEHKLEDIWTRAYDCINICGWVDLEYKVICISATRWGNTGPN